MPASLGVLLPFDLLQPDPIGTRPSIHSADFGGELAAQFAAVFLRSPHAFSSWILIGSTISSPMIDLRRSGILISVSRMTHRGSLVTFGSGRIVHNGTGVVNSVAIMSRAYVSCVHTVQYPPLWSIFTCIGIRPTASSVRSTVLSRMRPQLRGWGLTSGGSQRCRIESTKRGVRSSLRPTLRSGRSRLPLIPRKCGATRFRLWTLPVS
jgi:hypothetical protein